MKLFISQPMNGKEDAEILETRRLIFENFKSFIGQEDLELIDSYIKENIPEDAGRLWLLGDSIKLMDKADFVVFAPGYEKAKGCRIEYKVFYEYGLDGYYYDGVDFLKI